MITIVIDLPEDIEEMLYELAEYNKMDIETLIRELILREHFIVAPYLDK